ncbi:MAG: dTDP-glucose 4,6-dehydratase [Bacteroidales bacterium]
MGTTLLITGGAGFIGSHLVRYWVNKYPDTKVVNLDKLTYAGNLANLKDIENKSNYCFVKGDITEEASMRDLFNKYHFDGVIHLAAESHVDRSISHPMDFIMANIVGTVNLLNAARLAWHGKEEGKRFYHVSTDEVYGSLGKEGLFTEKTAYDPRSPYSAAKASSDHLVRAYFHTYGLPVVLSNCSNNYGGFQFPEKLIPLVIHNIRYGKALPVYGKGENVRDWLYVGDHVRAIDLIYHKGSTGETYNIGGNNEKQNIELVRLLCRITDRKLGRKEGEAEKLISFVQDRAGHDLRYAIDSSKLQKELDWKPSVSFEQGMEETVEWYLNHNDWLESVTSGDYQKYYEDQYKGR